MTPSNPIRAVALALLVAAPAVQADGPIPVTLGKHGERHVLLRAGEPYEVRGAGIEFGDKARFKARGGNSFRTWRTDNGEQTGQQMLDEAQGARAERHPVPGDHARAQGLRLRRRAGRA